MKVLTDPFPSPNKDFVFKSYMENINKRQVRLEHLLLKLMQKTFYKKDNSQFTTDENTN